MPNKYDIYEPPEGHFERFNIRLEKNFKRKPIQLYKYLTAAAIMLLFSIGLTLQLKPDYELSSISPEFRQTQEFFEGIIYQEINQIKKVQNTENKVVIENAMTKISELEHDYDSLKEAYRKNGYNKYIINAMIYNFQQRIEVLQLLQQTIEIKNNHKKTYHENNTI